MIGIFIAVIALIVYGSLYPWAFQATSLPASPLYILLHSWDANPTDRRFLFDVAVNIAIYIPLGMSGYLAFRRVRVFAPVAIGTLLSASMEMLQLYTPHRQCSSIDLVDNILGSAIGVIAGIAFTRIVDIPALRVRERGAVALLFCWIGALLFPAFPVLWLGMWRTKLSAFAHAPVLDPIPMLASAAAWFAVSRLLIAAGARRPMVWLAALLVLLPVQFGIMNRTPQPADFEGAAIALAACSFIGTDRLAGILLLTAVALRGLAPFHFEGPARAFLWVPFGGLLTNEWQGSIVILLGKLFQYGASIWLLARSGMGLLRATVFVTLVLALIEALQTRIPGHVAEINDPLLAVMLGLGFRALLVWRS
jgi:VanZ family protein